MPDNTECCGDNHCGPFQVRAADGRVIAECERREDAHAITRALSECGALAQMHREAKELSDSAKRDGVRARALLDQCDAMLSAAKVIEAVNAELLAASAAILAEYGPPTVWDEWQDRDGNCMGDRLRALQTAISKAEGGAA